nr:hypothetical protein [Actinomycetota bacterium]
ELLELRRAFEELSARPTGDPALTQRVQQIASRVESSASTDQIGELRRQIEDLAARPAEDPALTERVQQLASRLESSASADQIGELRTQIEDLAARPAGDPALSERVEQVVSRLEDFSTRIDLPLEGLVELREQVERLSAAPAADAALPERLAAMAEQLARTASTEQIGNIQRQLDELASRPGGDPALAERVEQIAARVAAFPSSERLDELSGRLEQLAARPAGDGDQALAEQVAELRRQIDDVAARSGGDPGLEERVGQLARDFQELAHKGDEHRGTSDAAIRALADDLRQSVEGIGTRVESLEEAAAKKGEVDYESHFSTLEDKLAEATSKHVAIEDGLDSLAIRVSAIDELKGRVEEMTDRFGAHESAQRKGAKKSDLATLRTELADRLETLDLRVESLATDADEAQRSVAARLDEAVQLVRNDLDLSRAAAEERMVEADQRARALREQVEQLHEAAAATGAERATAEADLARRIEKLGKRLSEELATPQAELMPALDGLRSEYESLAARLDRSDATTAGALAKLTADLEAVAQSSIDLLGHVERAGTGDTSELDARINRLELRTEADTARAEEQVRATEDALRAGLAALGSRLAETESTYIEAGGALRRSIERLGAAIVEADGVVAGHVSADAALDEPQSGPFLAFVPNGSGYGLQELGGNLPAVGEAVSTADDADEFVVTRVGRSPLPLDRRRCVYLERRSTSARSPDRVP